MTEPMQSIDDVPKPHITHLGMQRGKWPVHAFNDQGQAAFWAAQEDERYVWPIVTIRLGERQKGVHIPADQVLKPWHEITS